MEAVAGGAVPNYEYKTHNPNIRDRQHVISSNVQRDHEYTQKYQKVQQILQAPKRELNQPVQHRYVKVSTTRIPPRAAPMFTTRGAMGKYSQSATEKRPEPPKLECPSSISLNDIHIDDDVPKVPRIMQRKNSVSRNLKRELGSGGSSVTNIREVKRVVTTYKTPDYIQPNTYRNNYNKNDDFNNVKRTWYVSPRKTEVVINDSQPSAKRMLVRDEPATNLNSAKIDLVDEGLWEQKDVSLSDYVDQDMLYNYDDDDAWISSVDVSDFAGISQDLANTVKSTEDIIFSNTVHRRATPPPYHANPPPVHGPYPKPTWSYSSLIALALKNSEHGQLTVSEIYAFMLENFPYFRTAPPGWKNSVRHNLSLNKCFQKVDVDLVTLNRKSCLWEICPDKLEKLEQDIRKWREKGVVEGLANPADLEAIENGTKGLPNMEHYTKNVLKTSYQENKAITLNHRRYVAKPQPTSTIVTNDKTRFPVMTLSPPRMESRLPSPSRSPSPPLDLEFNDADQFSLYPTSSSSMSKRGYNDITGSPSRQSLDLLTGFTTPPRQSTRDEDGCSPISEFKYTYCWSSFDAARDALNDNSLMVAALEESPYKGPVTFPIVS